MSTSRSNIQPAKRDTFRSAILLCACSRDSWFPSELRDEACMPRMNRSKLMVIINSLVDDGFIQPAKGKTGFTAVYQITNSGEREAGRILKAMADAKEKAGA